MALAYVTAFVARADLALAGLFLPLWCSRFLQDNPETLAQISDAPAGCAEDVACLTIQGMERGGLLIGMVGMGSLLSAPLLGILCDRINRIHATAIALSINVVGYGLTGFVSDPFGVMAIPVCVVIGAGEVAGVIATQALVQQHAPVAHRGSVIGCFGVFGALGILVNSWIGGQLFDHWMFQGPFLWLAALNLVIVLVCLLTARTVPTPTLVAASSPPTR